MSFKLHAAALTVGLMGFVYCVTPATADEWDKMTTFHFSAPVEVPGHVLVPGTYMFKLADLQADRNVVEIFHQDRKGMDHLIATEMAIPAYRVNTPDRPVVTFEERPSNSPEAVHKWFYPGDNYGWEFVYPRAQRLQVASTVAPAPAAPAPTPAPAVAAQSTPSPAPAPAATEQQQTTVIAQNQAPPAAAAAPSTPPALPQQLPTTASDLPLLALLGLVMTGSGAGLLGFAFLRNRA
jgi:outer membrane biosynthesis protein TonB